MNKYLINNITLVMYSLGYFGRVKLDSRCDNLIAKL